MNDATAIVEEIDATLSRGDWRTSRNRSELRSLLARLRSVVQETAPSRTLGPLTIDRIRRSITLTHCAGDAETIWLTPQEWAVFDLLATHEVMEKARLLDAIQSPYAAPMSPNAVEVYVSRLRQKLIAAGIYVRTIRGVGYALEIPR